LPGETGTAVAAAGATKAPEVEEDPANAPVKPSTAVKASGRKAGKQPGSPGYGRTQKLAVTGTCDHRPEHCSVCARAISANAPAKPYTAWDEVDIAPPVEGQVGLLFSVIRHILFETDCDHCGHMSAVRSPGGPRERMSGTRSSWVNGVWFGPQLAGLIVFLALRLRLSRPRIREALMEMFGLLLSVGVIDETIRSDGYRVYRAWLNRLRCWPHLIRKLQGLAESSDGRVAGIGQEMEGLMKTLEKAIYAARVEPPPEGLPILYAAQVDRLKRLCTAHWSDAHSALRSVAREFLYDWEVIMRPLAEPHLPLSNNAAEQALRHWVIARNISHGTHSEAGTRAFALLASVIETCNRRGASSWRYLSRHRHPCGSQGPGASPASPYPGSRVKTEGV
jgi:hypothetical protein